MNRPQSHRLGLKDGTTSNRNKRRPNWQTRPQCPHKPL